MKKTLKSLTLCGVLISSFGVSSVSAMSPVAKEGELNLDDLIALEDSGMIIIDDTQKNNGDFSIQSVQPGEGGSSSTVSAGGGIFTVSYQLDRHKSIYQHYGLTHKSSASNKYSTVHSPWERPGVTASAWVKSSLTGNKANWNVR